MSSNNCESSKYTQKFDLCNINNRRKTPKFCPDCKETDDSIKLLTSKMSKIEEIIDGFKNCQKKKIGNFSTFNAKFTLNDVPCELEYDLSSFTLENLQKLVIFTTKNRTSIKN
ncbi:hypothetical protein RhiirA5_408892 [Rhizophagus irregularis]|uniref:Uncharacterized protein n=3 Tax=Rhizophagus irregularis TaxID=588596 RepID=U9T001_RHIID|nr:hypothetical protein GLOIN_2v1782085 [Rhizophagus irregularis DAOM 181602=DAOM 197198]PKC14871.1 hypothetical protein RhiirA5_408892 [Rhizophagus irregularis]PKY23632.1 hypothetical protein RhiirB3_437891 [Rhizophagus irregularis]POG65129.1 hypothetical protein GLOIN_2v1782085 [Rhizophagus irregularis DAOM 181602=DAOM 197198]UZO11411.1 hypothetical protein OCT59_002980 [Rhizophagus irregularis]CAB5383258.1 unnamed protein product [Rhizophagus irregularis]|eukprot:XP_025171995.1 hypothetical protein GLOIN_2v1782085 [Rhizophagus irregularis DAOM 181602=DAOM 197198]